MLTSSDSNCCYWAYILDYFGKELLRGRGGFDSWFNHNVFFVGYETRYILIINCLVRNTRICPFKDLCFLSSTIFHNLCSTKVLLLFGSLIFLHYCNHFRMLSLTVSTFNKNEFLGYRSELNENWKKHWKHSKKGSYVGYVEGVVFQLGSFLKNVLNLRRQKSKELAGIYIRYTWILPMTWQLKSEYVSKFRNSVNVIKVAWAKF